jgi:[ribosomal protein S18]-alanine N-acetyltransferase
MGIHLRAAIPPDLRALHELDKACFRRGIAYSLAEMRYFLSNPQSISLVAQDDQGNLAGFAIAATVADTRQRRGHIITIDVNSEYRLQGVGRALMTGVEAKLLETGVEMLRLEVADNDEGAQQFYRRMGYEVKGKIRGYYLGKLDALVMEKRLSPNQQR